MSSRSSRVELVATSWATAALFSLCLIEALVPASAQADVGCLDAMGRCTALTTPCPSATAAMCVRGREGASDVALAIDAATCRGLCSVPLGECLDELQIYAADAFGTQADWRVPAAAAAGASCRFDICGDDDAWAMVGSGGSSPCFSARTVGGIQAQFDNGDCDEDGIPNQLEYRRPQSVRTLPGGGTDSVDAYNFACSATVPIILFTANQGVLLREAEETPACNGCAGFACPGCSGACEDGLCVIEGSTAVAICQPTLSTDLQDCYDPSFHCLPWPRDGLFGVRIPGVCLPRAVGEVGCFLQDSTHFAACILPDPDTYVSGGGFAWQSGRYGLSQHLATGDCDNDGLSNRVELAIARETGEPALQCDPSFLAWTERTLPDAGATIFTRNTAAVLTELSDGGPACPSGTTPRRVAPSSAQSVCDPPGMRTVAVSFRKVSGFANNWMFFDCRREWIAERTIAEAGMGSAFDASLDASVPAFDSGLRDPQEVDALALPGNDVCIASIDGDGGPFVALPWTTLECMQEMLIGTVSDGGVMEVSGPEHCFGVDDTSGASWENADRNSLQQLWARGDCDRDDRPNGVDPTPCVYDPIDGGIDAAYDDAYVEIDGGPDARVIFTLDAGRDGGPIGSPYIEYSGGALDCSASPSAPRHAPPVLVNVGLVVAALWRRRRSTTAEEKRR